MSQIDTDHITAFKEFEFEGWETLSAAYGDCWGQITSAFIPAILRCLPTIKGKKLLDLATGPGYAAGVAAERGAQVCGIDFSPNMIDRARVKSPSVEFLVADALSLPFNDNYFDSVISNFGFQHFPDQSAALAESARVLKVGGTLSFTIWAGRTRNAASSILESALDRFATKQSPVPDGPSYDCLLDEKELLHTLSRAGFLINSIQSTLQVVPWILQDAEELFHAELSGSVRSGARLRNEPPPVLEKIRIAMSEDIQTNYKENGSLIIPMAAYIISGTKV